MRLSMVIAIAAHQFQTGRGNGQCESKSEGDIIVIGFENRGGKNLNFIRQRPQRCQQTRAVHNDACIRFPHDLQGNLAAEFAGSGLLKIYRWISPKCG